MDKFSHTGGFFLMSGIFFASQMLECACTVSVMALKPMCPCAWFCGVQKALVSAAVLAGEGRLHWSYQAPFPNTFRLVCIEVSCLVFLHSRVKGTAWLPQCLAAV